MMLQHEAGCSGVGNYLQVAEPQPVAGGRPLCAHGLADIKSIVVRVMGQCKAHWRPSGFGSQVRTRQAWQAWPYAGALQIWVQQHSLLGSAAAAAGFATAGAGPRTYPAG